MLNQQIENFETLINEMTENEVYAETKTRFLESYHYKNAPTEHFISHSLGSLDDFDIEDGFGIDPEFYKNNKEEILSRLPETVDLLTEDEKQHLEMLQSNAVTDNTIVEYVLADGNKFSASHNIRKDIHKGMYTYIMQKEWARRGTELKKQRESLGVSIAKLSRILETSPRRIGKLENGQPIQMSKHLEKAYLLALESIRNKRSESSKINHICLNQYYGGDLYLIELVTEDGQHVHMQDIEGLSWAYKIAKTRFQNQLNVPIILQSSNGGTVNMDELEAIYS